MVQSSSREPIEVAAVFAIAALVQSSPCRKSSMVIVERGAVVVVQMVADWQMAMAADCGRWLSW